EHRPDQRPDAHLSALRIPEEVDLRRRSGQSEEAGREQGGQLAMRGVTCRRLAGLATTGALAALVVAPVSARAETGAWLVLHGEAPDAASLAAKADYATTVNAAACQFDDDVTGMRIAL